ncbi:OB-fold-containig protein [Bradyrhizobium sp.]|jgi:membrane protein implicated in regulation of membrane protease activity|uniref:OB-fold-containig protein n=1 Tax=Bradyrhizobium sp. TaxID=376 RepID=UPI002B72F570|nr:OB-fold-containig protein [Bradyrhizobium sp.]HWX63870.1 OB-fold-containig protein [Bradyrhizobium sp.]
MGLIDHFLAPEVRPFAIAAVMIAIIGAIESLSMLIGMSLSEMMGKAIGFDHDSNSSFINALLWLNVGGVPLLIFILLALGLFSIAGFLIQDVARLVLAPLPAAIAALAAAAVALPLLRASTREVARVIPQDESYAVSLSDLIGRVGQVVVGPLDQGLPGRVRVKDVHDNWHTVMARAAPDSPPLQKGARVLLVDCRDRLFIAIAATDEVEVAKQRQT